MDVGVRDTPPFRVPAGQNRPKMARDVPVRDAPLGPDAEGRMLTLDGPNGSKRKEERMKTTGTWH